MTNKLAKAASLLGFISIFSVNAALADSFTASRYPTSFRPYATSEGGYVAGLSGPNNIPHLYLKSALIGNVGSLDYMPLAVNERGSVAGVQFGKTDTDSDFAIFTPLGQTSVVLRQDTDIEGIALDNNNNIAVIEKDTVSFFTSGTLTGSVLASTSQSFANERRPLLLTNGNLITKINDQGSDRYAVVSPLGTVSVLSVDVMPPSAKILREQNQQVLFLDGEKLFTSNLSNAPTVAVEPEKGLVVAFLGANGARYMGGNFYSDYYSEGVNKFGELSTPYVQLTSTSPLTRLSCLVAKKDKVYFTEMSALFNDGAVLVKDYESYALLTPPSGPISNNCAKLTARVTGSCAKYFKKTTQVKLIPSKIKRCEVQAAVRSHDGKPIVGASVVTSSWRSGTIFARGKTDRKGKLSFSLANDSGSPSVDVIAPYGDKRRYSDSVELSYNSGSDT